MKWVGESEWLGCQLCEPLVARVFDAPGRRWFADIEDRNSYEVAELGGFDSESAAKAAVGSWIGKTMAQLSNALAQGEPRTFDDDGA